MLCGWLLQHMCKQSHMVPLESFQGVVCQRQMVGSWLHLTLSYFINLASHAYARLS